MGEAKGFAKNISKHDILFFPIWFNLMVSFPKYSTLFQHYRIKQIRSQYIEVL